MKETTQANKWRRNIETRAGNEFRYKERKR